MVIRQYLKNEDEDKLMKMIEGEGKEWACYWADEFSAKYRAALNMSIRPKVVAREKTKNTVRRSRVCIELFRCQ